jgi:hypothetical protein
MNAPTSKPWYRHVWPWLLMVPPVGAVVGGGITLYLAVTRPDTLVRKDCFKDGVTMVCGEEAQRVRQAGAGEDPVRPAQ